MFSQKPWRLDSDKSFQILPLSIALLEDAANEDELDIDLLMELHKLRERALYEVLEEEGDDDDWDLDEALEEFNEADNVILVDQDTDGGTKEWGIQTDGDPEEWEI